MSKLIKTNILMYFTLLFIAVMTKLHFPHFMNHFLKHMINAYLYTIQLLGQDS